MRMTYSSHSIVRPIAGRLALDFLNTANWSADDRVFQEKIEDMKDLDIWMGALELSDAIRPGSVDEILGFRSNLRSVFLGGGEMTGLNLGQYLGAMKVQQSGPVDDLRRQPILGLIAVSALAILSDRRELSRVKKCPGPNCGWLFLDETKNARRKWCIMETCGNRAKAARNYAKKTHGQGVPG